MGDGHGWELDVVSCVVCPNCAFTFAASHEQTDGTGYECPECGCRSDGTFDGRSIFKAARA